MLGLIKTILIALKGKASPILIRHQTIEFITSFILLLDNVFIPFVEAEIWSTAEKCRDCKVVFCIYFIIIR